MNRPKSDHLPAFSLIKELLESTISKNLSFAFYFTPHQPILRFCSGELVQQMPDVDAENIFVLCPFDISKGISYIHITETASVESCFLPDLRLDKKYFYLQGETTISEVDFRENVLKAVDLITKGELEKVVLSRSMSWMKSYSGNIIKLLTDLHNAYPDAFVSLCSTPLHGTWLCASPEVLLKCHDGRFETLSLAGTINQQPDAGNNDFSAKELYEQEIVTDYISDVLKRYGLDFEKTGPAKIKYGDLFHLGTIFQGTFPKEKSLLRLAFDLHPTPAIGGFPKQPAMNFILENEAPRDLYGGFTGPFNNAHNFEFYVHLRCMKLFEKHSILFAGAGITKDSDPEKEYLETAMKMNNLEKFLT